MFKAVQAYYCSSVAVSFLSLVRLWLSLAIATTTTTMTTTTATTVAKPGCQARCGNITIPYPFGVGHDGACSLSDSYNVYCNTSYDPPKPFLGFHQIMDISAGSGQMRIKNSVATRCYHSRGQQRSLITNGTSFGTINMGFENYPLLFSDTANKFVVVGCNDYARMDTANNFSQRCIATCSTPDQVLNGSCNSCSTSGCCQTTIPKGFNFFAATIVGLEVNANVAEFNPCSHVFLGEEDKFNFTVADLSDSNFVNRIEQHVPVVLEWFVGVNQSCRQAMENNRTTYACQQNTACIDFQKGYRCRCLPGYQGNPYLYPGCIDIDECIDESQPCSHICTNTPGSYICSCPKGHHEDSLKNGTRCISDHSQFATRFILGMSFGFLFLLMILCWIYFTIKRKKLIKMREQFFEQNGGLLFKQLLFENGRSMEVSKVFSSDELKAATNNYSDDHILGKGGYGIVYKGILDGREIAIKKSKMAGDESQVDQFINEVVILTQINHRNVVKLLGCCLETEVPLLVYELISNGTLFDHIRRNKGNTTSWLTWENCIKLAAEVIDALAYLHSAASMPIIHRDVKSANILLDDNYTAKLSDFGASRLISIDQTQVTTLVQGTLGYLDPEYFHTSQLTEKSDVYSIGVVLAELLTKEKPICLKRRQKERNLATYFVLAMKEDRLTEILDPILVREASEEQLIKMAKLVKECLNVKGEERPTMKELALELEGLRKQNSHPLVELSYEETTDLMGEHDLDLDPSNYHQNRNVNIMESSSGRQYSMELSLISEMNHPR